MHQGRKEHFRPDDKLGLEPDNPGIMQITFIKEW